MELSYGGVSWLAVIVAAIANIVIGFIWYLPQVFGSRWSALSGLPLPTPTKVPPMTIVAGVVVALVAAYVLALVEQLAGAKGLADGAVLGFLAWIGFVATTSYASVLWEGRPIAYWAINAGSLLVGFVVMGAIIGYWT
jgi:hypothetical protein